jgi:hypothetical protein
METGMETCMRLVVKTGVKRHATTNYRCRRIL